MIGKRLKELRLRKNLKQKDLAELFGVSISNISFYEREVRNPSYKLIVKIAEYFEVTPDFLIGDIEPIKDYKEKETAKIFAERFKKLRVQRGYKQWELSKKLNLVNSTVCGYESGRRMPTLDILVHICEELEVSPNYFLGFEIDNERLTKSELKAIKLIDSMGLNLLDLIDDLSYLFSKYGSLLKN